MKTSAAARRGPDAHVPPQNIEAEESVLGAMLVAEPALTRVIDEVKLNAEDFYLDKHAVIFGCVHALYAASKPVDELSVAEALVQRNQIEEAGGKHYVSELAAKVPAAGNAKHYAEIVQQNSLLRRLLGAGQQIQGWVHERDGASPGDLYSKALALVEQARPDAAGGGAQATPLAAIERQQVSWLWPGRVPLGMLTLLIGDPGLGKSLLTIDVAAKVTRAGSDVLLLDGENHAGATTRPRAEAAGAALDRLHIVTLRRDGLDEGLALPEDAAELDRLIERTGAKLVVIDPLMAHLHESVNSWRDQSVRRALAPLHRSAEAHDCAVIVVAHLNKAMGASPLYRAGGSIGIPAAVRSALLLARDPEDEDLERGSRRVLAHVKCNVAPQAESLAATIATIQLDDHSEAARFEVTGRSEISASDLLLAPVGEHRTKRDDAADFLREELGDGPVPTKELQAAARAAGIGWRTVEDAKAGLGIKATRAGFGAAGYWTWELPTDKDRTDKDRGPYISNSAVYGESALVSQIEDDSDPVDRIDRKAVTDIGTDADIGVAA